VTGWFDNSVANPANPDPTVAVPWGPQTHEEMNVGYVEYYLDDSATRSEAAPTPVGIVDNEKSP
jgi:hypothetical protein